MSKKVPNKSAKNLWYKLANKETILIKERVFTYESVYQIVENEKMK